MSEISFTRFLIAGAWSEIFDKLSEKKKTITESSRNAVARISREKMNPPPYAPKSSTRNNRGDTVRDCMVIIKCNSCEHHQERINGFIISEDGYILTLKDRVCPGADVAVYFQWFKDFGVVQDTGSNSYLALIKVDVQNLDAIEFGSSATLKRSDSVYAFGRDDQGRAGFSPGKVIDPLKSVTWSCLDFVQTNALVHKLNHGGPLVDSDWKLVGINTWMSEESHYSIPVGYIKAWLRKYCPDAVKKKVTVQKTKKSNESEASLALDMNALALAEPNANDKQVYKQSGRMAQPGGNVNVTMNIFLNSPEQLRQVMSGLLNSNNC